MPSSLFGPGSQPRRSAQDIARAQAEARAADARQQSAASAAGRGSRSIAATRRVDDDADEM